MSSLKEQDLTHATHEIFTHNIVVKIGCDQKKSLSHMFLFGQVKLLGTLHSFLNLPWFFKSLPWSGIEIYVSKLSNITISFWGGY